MGTRIVWLTASVLIPVWTTADLAASDTGEAVPRDRYANRAALVDPTARPCPDTPRTLTQVRDNLYPHTSAALPALHSGLVLVTSEGALVIDTRAAHDPTIVP